MAIGGAFLGGGVEVVPAGSCKLELEILTEDRANLTATFTIKGTSTYTVTAGADGRAVYTVPAGQTYTVSVNTTGYDNIASQTVIAESGTVRYVRFEAFSGRVKRTGDTMTGTLAVVGGASIDTNGQVIGKKLRATADIHLGSSPSSYAVINDGWIQNRTLDETKADLGITGKQDKLTAGDNITISGTTISAKDTTYDVATQSANGLMSSADKTKLDGVDSALAGKVSKSGDTMTGDLSTSGYITMFRSYPRMYMRETDGEVGAVAGGDCWLLFQDKNGAQTGVLSNQLINMSGQIGSNTRITSISKLANGSLNYRGLKAIALPDGTGYATAPSWSPGNNDNSDKILTIKMANSLPSLVHTTGNETVAGNKTFTGALGLLTPNPQFIVKDTNGDTTVQPSSSQTLFYLQVLDKNGKVYCNLVTVTHRASDNAIVSSFGNSGRTWSGGIKITTLPDGTEYADCPTTPSGATGKEIATANWSLSKFQRKITYGTGDPPSGGQAGDIYIKI